MGHYKVVDRFCALLRRRSGAAAVEFAIIAPVFILLFMGMIAYGIYFGAIHSLEPLVADAVRISTAGLGGDEREELVQDFLDAHAAGYAFIDPDKLQVQFGDDPAGTQFTVTIRYDAADLPIWALFDPLPLPGQTILRSSTIRIGGL